MRRGRASCSSARAAKRRRRSSHLPRRIPVDSRGCSRTNRLESTGSTPARRGSLNLSRRRVSNRQRPASPPQGFVMRHIITSVVAVLSVLHVFAPIASADPRAEVESAKAQLDFAESRRSRAACDVNDARVRYDDLASRHAAAIAALNSAVADRDAVVRKITSSERLLPDLAQAFENARRAGDGYARSIPEAERRANETAAAVDEFRAAAFAEFQASPAWSDVISAITAAEADYDAAAAARLDALFDDDAYIARLIELLDAEDELEAQRDANPQDAMRLASLGNAWMEALYAITRMETDALSQDPNVIAALVALREARSEQQRVRREFELALDNDPRLLELAAAHVAARESLDVAVAGARAADSEANRLHHELARAERLAAECRDRLGRFDNDLAHLQSAIDAAGRDLQHASLEVHRATQDYELAERERDVFAGRLRQVIERATEEHARREREHERERRAREHTEHGRQREDADRREL